MSKSTLPELIQILPVKNELGEGIIWEAQSGSACWTDIENSLIYKYQLETEMLQSWKTPERVGCFAPLENQDYLVVGFETGFAYFNPETGWLKWLHKIEQDMPGTRLNDGRTDRQGRFWAGTMVEDASLRDNPDYRGTLYCLDAQLNCTSSISGLVITNSLCWSPDSKYMYHTDTPTRRIDRYDFNADTAEVSNKTTFVETPEGHMPDGSIVDADGYLWNAQWGASQVVRYTPEGEVDLILPTPASQPTCVAFGGPDLNILFVTSATQDLSQEELHQAPEAGDVFIYETEFTGLLESSFKPEI